MTNTELSDRLGRVVRILRADAVCRRRVARAATVRALTATVMLAIGGGGGALLFAAASEPWMVIAAMTLIGIGCSPVLMASVFIFPRAASVRPVWPS